MNPYPTIGMTVAASGTDWVYSTPSTSPPAIGSEWPGNQGVVIAGPASNGPTWWEVAFNDGLTGWTYQSGLALVSPTAPPVSFSANPASIPPGVSSTLSWSSTNATSCSGAGFSPSGVSGSLSVLPTATTVYSITCTGSGGSTTQSAEVVVNPYPTIGATVAAEGAVYAYPTSSLSKPPIGFEAPGNQGVVIGGPASNGFTWWKVAFNDNLTGWVYQSGLALASPTAPTLSFSASPSGHRPWRLVDAVMVVDQRDFLQRSRLFSIGPLGVSPRLAGLPTTYSVACTAAADRRREQRR